MRTIKHILITGCIALAVSSCDYLDQQPYEYWQPEETFIDYNKTIQMLNSVYVSMPNGYQSNYTPPMQCINWDKDTQPKLVR